MESLHIELDLVNWMEFCMEILIRGERGLAGGGSLEKTQMDPDSGMWKEFCSEIVECALAWVTGRVT